MQQMCCVASLTTLFELMFRIEDGDATLLCITLSEVLRSVDFEVHPSVNLLQVGQIRSTQLRRHVLNYCSVT